MKYRKFGNTDLNVSEICYGTMRYASKTGQEDEQSKAATRALEEAVDSGVNFIHSSYEYGTRWLTGDVLGRHPRRHDLHHIIKVNVPDWGEPRFEPGKFRERIEEALRELKVDRIAIVQHLHRGTLARELGYCDEGEPKRLGEFDEVTQPLVETFEQLRQEGKVGYLTTFPYTVGYARHAIESGHFAGVVAYYNALETEMYDLFPAMQERGQSFIGIRPFAAGLLTDRRINRDSIPADDRMRGTELDRLYDQLAEFRAALSTAGVAEPESWTRFAIRFALAHPAITSTVVGINTPEQLRATLAAVDDPAPGEEVVRTAHEICTRFRKKFGVQGNTAGVLTY